MTRPLPLSFAVCAMVCARVSQAAIPTYDYEVVHAYPHDASAFTEGLFYLNGYLYESTGLEEHSSIRKVRLETGEVVQKLDIPAQYFGEGIVDWHGHLISLTWKTHVGFVFDLHTFKLQREFHYEGEGWALTRNDRHLIMSDGTSQLRYLDPKTLRQTGKIEVTVDGKALSNVNELEWVKGQIYANVWQTNWIVRIDPSDGRVVGAINMNGLLKPADIVKGQTDVLNGIAYDAKNDRLFVTGKNWPKVFEVRLHESTAPRP
ncbi:MAG TPA: glutaminyl-peptide cyclotransferase [Steroidobacteraceae bacterium]|jgi:glutaminyl-peptide cyclotransferase|nr:glutaminyl-peptide cyclotransferase [Steroidobacteraceae bacterium]